MGVRRWESGDGRWELGDGSRVMGIGRWELEDGSREIGVERWELGDGSREIGVGRWESRDGRWKLMTSCKTNVCDLNFNDNGFSVLMKRISRLRQSGGLSALSGLSGLKHIFW